MPTILRKGPYRFFFYSHETNEPPHIHVERDMGSAKIWLEPPCLASCTGFAPKEFRRIVRLTEKNRVVLLEAWNDFFGKQCRHNNPQPAPGRRLYRGRTDGRRARFCAHRLVSPSRPG
ncbi:DUF4160 domain-containing protein [Erythrobacter jejuensis]|uniref:DUF4160 domain-containing protein n=1 Tax=Parerythrobacter jejuensis TaxID=795812 RepID=A0A845AU09_9SPHN|nr:DUF4160 domain-containing protein [Parerythrobacter jejuensis]MXP33088.1 DUF4160 domain-containing protein [Parerythrobacter jejuensis]